jgi:hemerythrin-like domain-containing protein
MGYMGEDKISKVAKELMEEHEKLGNKLFQTVNRFRKMKKEQFQLKVIEEALKAYFDVDELWKEFDRHEAREEEEVFPELIERGEKKVIDDLVEQHEILSNIRKEARDLLVKYKEKKIGFKELKKKFEKRLYKFENILNQHMQTENELFHKMV